MKTMILLVLAAALSAMLLGGWSWHDSQRASGANASWAAHAQLASVR